jgi:hypothetical protein
LSTAHRHITQQFLGFTMAKKRDEMTAVAMAVEREAVRAKEEVGLGKVCVALWLVGLALSE